MPRIIQQIHLSAYQARVMLIAHQAQSPELAFAQLGNEDPRIESNLLGARETLAKLGLLEVGENYVAVTPEGEEVMRDEFLIDEMGEVTEKGDEILQQHSDQQQQQGPPGEPPMSEPQGQEAAPVSMGGEMETTPGAGFPAEGSIFRDVHDLSKLKG